MRGLAQILPRQRSKKASSAASVDGVAQRHTAALLRQRARRRRADHEFLPAALEVLETPPAPLGLWFMAAITVLAMIALLWAYIGRIDVVAIAQGKVQAVGRTKTIQPLETGRVRAIRVENGQSVRVGDVLIELDASVSRAEEATLQAGLDAFAAEAKRRRTALEIPRLTGTHAGSTYKAPRIAWSVNTPANIAEREQSILDNDVARLVDVMAALEATMREKTAERDRLRATIVSEERLITILKERVGMRTTLLEKAIGSRSNVIDSLEVLETQQTYLTNMQGQAVQAVAAIESAQREIDKSYTAFVLDNSQRLADAERQVEEARTRLAKAQLITGHAVLRSPIDGIVQGVSVLSTGQVVQSGEAIMQIVPSEGGLEIEAYLLNQDVGFVRAGQEATVKLEAFPFNRYGTLPGTVVRVAEDAIPEVDARQREENPVRGAETRFLGGGQRTQNLVFPMMVRLGQSQIDVDGRPVRLMPGMAVAVEVRTGSRRILEYLFSPLTEVASVALRER